MTVTQVQSFLGFCNYYWKFIRHYALVAKPLYQLVSGDNAKAKRKEVEWSKECEEAFLELKKICSNTPILAYADYQRPFKVHTDASESGLGAVLYQDQEDGTTRVVAYTNRSLSKSEKRYHSSKLEFLALKWSICERFHDYLYGGEFEVHTDNNPLTYVLMTAKLDATGQQWVASLANYNFKIFYQSGKPNVEADALSRIQWDDPLVIKAILLRGKNIDTAIPQPFETAILAKNMQLAGAPEIPNQDWKCEQGSDKDIGLVIELIKQKRHLQYVCKEGDPSGMRVILKYKQDLELRNGLQYRKVKLQNHDGVIHQFVLPENYRKRAIMALHDDFGHLGIEKMLGLLKDRFFWLKMSEDVRQYIRTCGRCIRFKQPVEKAEMKPILCTYLMELVHIDFLTVGHPESERQINLMVITDHFTQYTQAYVTPNQTAPVAKTLWEQFLTHYGWPSKILTDQGKSFENNLFRELCALAQVQKLRTTPYRPQSNGSCERFNQMLIRMLGTLPQHVKRNWSEWVYSLMHAYNATVSQATGFSPFHLMYGRYPILPIDVELGVTLPDLTATKRQNFAKKLKVQLKWAFKVARETNDKDAT